MSSTLIVAARLLYVATTATFGCTSEEEVAKLNQLRATGPSFEHELYDQVFLGQCVIIAKGTAVDANERTSDPATLLVDRTIVPPGYIAPSADFAPMKTGAKG